MKRKKLKVNKKSPRKDDNILKKTWDFLWNDDSLLSWIVFLAVIFLFIKFIFFPSLSLIFGTSLPIVIVESCSMYHDTNNFDVWWEENGEWYEDSDITKEQFEQFPLKNGFNKGDIFLVTGIKKSEIKLGEVIIFTSGNSLNPIIHRVIDLDPLGTKGDNNNGQFIRSSNPGRIDETSIKENQIIGKSTNIRVPLLGWLKLIFFEPFRNDRDSGFCK